MSQSHPDQKILLETSCGSSGAAMAAANGGEGPVCDEEELHMQSCPAGEPEKGLRAELKQEPEWEGEHFDFDYALPLLGSVDQGLEFPLGMVSEEHGRRGGSARVEESFDASVEGTPRAAVANGSVGPLCKEEEEELHLQLYPEGYPEKWLQAELKQEQMGEPLTPGRSLPGSAEGLKIKFTWSMATRSRKVRETLRHHGGCVEDGGVQSNNQFSPRQLRASRRPRSEENEGPTLHLKQQQNGCPLSENMAECSDSDPEIFRPTKRTKSEVWSHFGFCKSDGNLLEDKHPVCKTCRKKIPAKGGNTSNLMSHLRLNHPLLYRKCTSVPQKIMAKRTAKTERMALESSEESSLSALESSEESSLSALESSEESSLSSPDSELDSEAEDMFEDGQDFRLDKPSDSGEDWEPASKQGRTSSGPPTTQRGPGRGRARGRSSSPAWGSSSTPAERWNDVDVPDITPPQPTFRPAHEPGPQGIIATATYTALNLFQLFFTNAVLETIIRNTNEYGSTHSNPSNPWTDLTLQDMFAFMSLVIFMGVVKCKSFTDYWRGGRLYKLPFPKQVMTGKKFLWICRSLHLSSAVADATNRTKRGTAGYDRLCKIRPLYDWMRDACRIHYHPGQEIAIGERMVASKARIGLKQYMRYKPVRWGYKLFVLADSSNGYTWDFFVYEGKMQGVSGKGLSYDSVMELVNTQSLGTGYKLFVGDFYTSPTLFSDLLRQEIWACGTIRTNRIGFPQTTVNSLTSKSTRGSIRWIRKDPLLFVHWRNTRDVFLCSTLHTAHCGDTVPRKVKGADGQLAMKDVPVPPAVKEYKKSMGGVDLSHAKDKVLHKTKKWYKTFFYHFMEIAIVNAYILHKNIAQGKGQVPMTQKTFRETLAGELADVGASPSTTSPGRSPGSSSRAHHRPVYIAGSSTDGRLKCIHCKEHRKTPVKCSSCDVALCFVGSRDCYNDWHIQQGL